MHYPPVPIAHAVYPRVLCSVRFCSSFTLKTSIQSFLLRFHQEFADDIELEFSHRDPQVMETTLSVAVSSLEKWLTSIGLLLNRQKTQVMFIGARNAAPVQHVMRCQAEGLQTVTSVKYIGLHLDSNFSWTTHIDHLTNKCRQATACLWRYRNCFTRTARRAWYVSIVQSSLVYASNAFFPSLSMSS